MAKILILLLSIAAFCTGFELAMEFQLPSNIEPISLEADGTGRHFILDSSGHLTAFDGDTLVAEIDPTSKSVTWIEPCDMDFASGWLYIADRSGSAIYITDKYLRSPARIGLDLDGESVRPSKIAVSSDGRMLIWDSDRAELMLYKDWREKTPISQPLPIAVYPENIELTFDFAKNAFFVLVGDKILEYSILGGFQRIIDFSSQDSDSRLLTAGTIDGNFCLIDNRGVWRLDDDWAFRLKANPSIAEISLRGRIVIVEEKTLKVYK